MEIRRVLRPVGSLTHAASSSCSAATRSPVFRSAASRRHQSSTSRTKKMLKIPPHPDFLTPYMGQNHVIFNPPSAPPSVYHTPFKFLPKSDPRRQANLSQLLRSASDPHASGRSTTQLPPPSRASELREKRYNVTKEQVEEMRKLRAENPEKWSVLNLADKFECSPLFVMMCCRASPEHKANERERLQAIKARWGPIRTTARDDRRKRMALLLRGGL
ncbi:mitochondrial ribosomal protein subunit L20-domain-containing protein [Xylaria cf. heliscus]|nr:mitochondrial ribosomal protein subunit L20-domain-containing protein [Xylaria cf. heliscus]